MTKRLGMVMFVVLMMVATVQAAQVGDQSTHTAGGVDFNMRLAPAATFPTGIEGIPDDERRPWEPQPGTATVDTPFWIAETVVTYELWYTVRQWALRNGYTFANAGMEGSTTGGGSYPSYKSIGRAPSSRRNEPVTMVSWRDSIVWCNALSEMVGLDPVYTHNSAVIKDATNVTACDNAVQEERNGFRLPTSDEWELAARYNDGQAWTPGHYASGASANTGNAAATQAVAWYSANSVGKTQSVGTLAANALGVYDMSGNVWEWTFTRGGSGRVNRGGGWDNTAGDLRVGRGGSSSPSRVIFSDGFRFVRTQF